MNTPANTDRDASERDEEENFHDFPGQQFIGADGVMLEMIEVSSQRAINLSAPKVFVLAMLAGAFIVVGGLFSVFLGAGVETPGLGSLLEGFGFSVGFFLVILTGALLFTEINVEVPTTFMGLLRRKTGSSTLFSSLLRLWGLAAVGNMVGSFLIGAIINYSHDLSPVHSELLQEIVASKLRYQEIGGVDGFLQAIVSGMLGNWLVGMAAFLSVMGRTIIGKFIPVFLLVSAFVSFGFLHSPANMAYFSLFGLTGEPTPWANGLLWSILPAAIGNMLGAFFLVALPFWYAGTRKRPKVSSNG